MNLGPYTLREKIGQGVMGEVHLAHAPRLEREVALKVLPAALRAFLTYWGEADREIPSVADARRRLAELEK